jgi:hypothetical protein
VFTTISYLVCSLQFQNLHSSDAENIKDLYSSFDGSVSFCSKKVSSAYFLLLRRVRQKQNIRVRFLFHLSAIKTQAGAAKSTFKQTTLIQSITTQVYLNSSFACVVRLTKCGLIRNKHNWMASIKTISISPSYNIEKQALHNPSLEILVVYWQYAAKVSAAKPDNRSTSFNNCGQKARKASKW